MSNNNSNGRRRKNADSKTKKLSTSPQSVGRRVLSIIFDNICFAVGSSLYSVAVIAFAVPNSIAQSGATGLAIILNHLFDIPIGTANMLINIPLLAIAWIVIGWRFVAKTMWVTVILSASLDLWNAFLPFVYQGDRILAALFCGVLTGAGLAIVFMRGATTGGTDIVGRLIRKRWPHISMGKIIMAADALIIALSSTVFRSFESALYAVIVIFVSTQLIDYILYGAGSGKMLMVVTDKAQDVAQAITGQLNRGVTILPVRGGYTGKDKDMLICAVRKSEVAGLTKTIWSIDKDPFIIVSEAGEILGEGFRSGLE